MTVNDVQRAYLAIFAAREAGQGASADQMKAIAMCMRNRVRQGWHEGDWIKVIENADEYRANPPQMAVIDANDRNFQILVRDIDDIYFSRRDWDQEPSNARMPDLDEAIGNCCYWAFANRPLTEWFHQNINQKRTLKTHIGLMMFYT